MCQQLEKLDGILADLKKHKAFLMDALKDLYDFIPSHDSEGDCCLALPFRFETAEQALAFTEAVKPTIMGAHRPLDTDRHVYCNWEPIMQQRGAVHPAMDPFKMEANKHHPDYRPDMCPRTLDLLSKTVYFRVSPDWTQERMEVLRDVLIAAKQKI